MLFSRHIYWTTLGHILFILATAGTGLWLIISQQGVVIGILLVICSLFQIGRLVNKLNSFNQKLRLFFDAIEDKDNMLYFPENNVSAALLAIIIFPEESHANTPLGTSSNSER